jgi:hypothetical protein
MSSISARSECWLGRSFVQVATLECQNAHVDPFFVMDMLPAVSANALAQCAGVESDEQRFQIG